MNKRDLLRSLLEGSPPYTPAAFFLHFGAGYAAGETAIKRHLDYFHYTDMDFVKIQYELPFPRLADSSLFDLLVRPFDLGLMGEAASIRLAMFTVSPKTSQM